MMEKQVMVPVKAFRTRGHKTLTEGLDREYLGLYEPALVAASEFY